jgi:hypothetical protein
MNYIYDMINLLLLNEYIEIYSTVSPRMTIIILILLIILLPIIQQ